MPRGKGASYTSEIFLVLIRGHIVFPSILRQSLSKTLLSFLVFPSCVLFADTMSLPWTRAIFDHTLLSRLTSRISVIE
jgi:hypothetical protein